MNKVNYENFGASRDTNNRRLRLFETLEHDWDGYGARPTSKTVIGHARALLYEIRSVKLEPEIFPLADGGIQFEWDIDEFYLELDIYNDHYVIFAIDAEGRYPYGEDGTQIGIDPRLFVDVYLTKHFRL